jgi:DNA polymerase-3 subunit gamma/tau
MAEQAASVNTDALTRIMEVWSECEMRLRDAASKKILVEVALLKAIEARQTMSLDSVLQQLQSLRGGNGTGGAPAVPQSRQASTADAAAPATAAKPRTATYAQPAEPTVAASPAVMESAAPVVAKPGNVDLQQIWSRLVELVGRASPFTRTYLLEAHVVSFTKNLFTIGFDPEFEDHISLVDNARNHALLQTKLAELGHANAQFKFIKAERPADWAVVPPESAPEPVTVATSTAAPAKAPAAGVAAPKEKPASKAFSKDDFKNDPLIQKALEVFKGKIVDVRG